MQKRECQDAEMMSASREIGRVRVLCMRAVDHLQRKGPISLASRAAAFVRRRALGLLRHEQAVAPASLLDYPILALQPGDWVEVKSEEAIRRALDDTGRTRGLGFMPSMSRYCGTQLRVYKRVETIVLEGTGQTRRLKDTVLLEGAICDGEGFVCDRSCFYFWKEAWLTRVPPPA